MHWLVDLLGTFPKNKVGNITNLKIFFFFWLNITNLKILNQGMSFIYLFIFGHKLEPPGFLPGNFLYPSLLFINLTLLFLQLYSIAVTDKRPCTPPTRSTMSSEESQTLSSDSAVEPPQNEQSKKAAKKEAAKQEKLRRRQEAAALASTVQSVSVEDDPLAANYGDVPILELQSKVDVRNWTEVGALTEALRDRYVVVHGRAQTIRAVGKNMAFVVVREKGFTIQCVVTAQPDVVSRQMVKYVAALSRESIVDIEGVVSVPDVPIKGATQQVSIYMCLCVYM
jgi:hypothetical protein